jgi:hypothetical protein
MLILPLLALQATALKTSWMKSESSCCRTEKYWKCLLAEIGKLTLPCYVKYWFTLNRRFATFCHWTNSVERVFIEKLTVTHLVKEFLAFYRTGRLLYFEIWILSPWRWRQHVPPKHWLLSTRIHGISAGTPPILTQVSPGFLQSLLRNAG